MTDNNDGPVQLRIVKVERNGILETINFEDIKDGDKIYLYEDDKDSNPDIFIADGNAYAVIDSMGIFNVYAVKQRKENVGS